MKKKKKLAIPDEAAILAIFEESGKPLRAESVISLAHPGPAARKQLDKILRSLAGSGKLVRLPGGFYTLPPQTEPIIGEYSASQRGHGVVTVLEPGEMAGKQLFISPFQRHDAWHMDLVSVAIEAGRPGKGKILAVLKRRQTEIPAILEAKSRRSLFFRAADGRLDAKFRVAADPGRDQAATPGDLARIKPVKKLDKGMWLAELLAWRGPADRVKAQEAIVKESQQVPMAFPALAISQAAALAPVPDPADIAEREDMRHVAFVTIDGADARDFDDAVHVEKTGDGYILRVAIADVSHYVREDGREGSLDMEARARGNSWYFPTSVEPMLPKELSNGLCSLRPGEDRLAMLVEMPFDSHGQAGAPRFAAIAMRSSARLVYGDVARFFAGCADAVPAALAPMLANARELYGLLAKNRRARGSLDFEMPEPDYEFDAEGRLLAMRDAERTDANRLIEEFMIAANEAVAAWLGARNAAFLYRIHPAPEPAKLKILQDTLLAIAPEALPPGQNTLAPADIQHILLKTAGTPQEFAVNRMCLRAMGQARYQTRNIGHFGLASRAYCHFTSPIRRYADLLVHRALKDCLAGKPPMAESGRLDAIGGNLNFLERRAAECEREMTKRMACLALAGREGEAMAGTISGVTDFGVFVELSALPAEGMISMEELGNDWFELIPERQMLLGSRSGRIFQLGQPISCVLLNVNVETQQINLRPCGPVAKIGKSRRIARKNGPRQAGAKAPKQKRHSASMHKAKSEQGQKGSNANRPGKRKH